VDTVMTGVPVVHPKMNTFPRVHEDMDWLFEDDEEHFHLKDNFELLTLERERGGKKQEHMRPTFVTATHLIANTHRRRVQF